MQSCSAVRATCWKQRTPKLWMEGREEGCGLFCVLRSYFILGRCLNNFVVDCSLLLENSFYCISRFFFSRSMTWLTNWNFVTTLLLGNTLLKSILVNSLDVSIVQITETCGTLVLWLATQQKIQRFTMPSDTRFHNGVTENLRFQFSGAVGDVWLKYTGYLTLICSFSSC